MAEFVTVATFELPVKAEAHKLLGAGRRPGLSGRRQPRGAGLARLQRRRRDKAPSSRRRCQPGQGDFGAVSSFSSSSTGTAFRGSNHVCLPGVRKESDIPWRATPGMWRRAPIAAAMWTCLRKATAELLAEAIAAAESSPKSLSHACATSLQLWIEVLAVLCLAYVPALFGRVPVALRSATAYPFVGYVLSRGSLRQLRYARAAVDDHGVVQRRMVSVSRSRPRLIMDLCSLLRSGAATLYDHSSRPCCRRSGTEKNGPIAAAHHAAPHGLPAYHPTGSGLSVGGFTEELMMRGYLIPRLDTPVAGHGDRHSCDEPVIRQLPPLPGIAPAIVDVAAGLVYGISFCLCRRLWPLCLAPCAGTTF